MVRTVIPFRRPARDAELFARDIACEEGGEVPLGAAETAEIESVWDALGGLDAEDFGAAGDEGRRHAPRPALVAGAAVLAASLALGAAFLWAERPVVHQSGVGERSTVVLPDGSRVTLNTDTRIQVRVTDRRREVTLQSGEAFFMVEHRADDVPFDVLTHDARVRVTGTRFNVYRQAGFTDIDLIEGAVQVGPVAREGGARVTLRPGEAVRVAAPGGPGPVSPAQAERIADWRQGRVSFHQTALGDAVAEMNRYSRTRLRLADAHLETMRVDGVFEAGDTAAFAQALQALHGVHIRRHGADWTLSAPGDR